MTVRTVGDKLYRFQMTVLDRTALAFRVQACSDVHLALSTIPGRIPIASYEIHIGDGNAVSFIRSYIGGAPEVKHLLKFSFQLSESR